MTRQQIEYSKEIAAELTAIPVVLPGDPVSVGEFITFPEGRSGIPFFRKMNTWGRFEVISRLQSLGDTAAESGTDGSRDTYEFASKNGTKVDFDLGGGTAGASGSLEVTFSAEGAVYFLAADCATERLNDLTSISVDLNAHKSKIAWKDTFLVTSLTVAARALIMQSSSSSGSLKLAGDVKSVSAGTVTAKTNIEVQKVSSASLIKPWSEKVTVFFGLHRFEKRDFGSGVQEVAPTKQKRIAHLVQSEDDRYVLSAVSPQELL